jgi:hypothetical protein
MSWQDEHVPDQQLREVLHRKLRAAHPNVIDARIVDELGVAGQVRIDVALINGSFSGFEIKSAEDSLRRLPNQIEVYSQVLDYATLVVDTAHLHHATKLLPPWWGVTEARVSASGVRLLRRRQGRRNRSLDPTYLSSLLWRDEALHLLDLAGEARGYRGRAGQQIRGRLVEVMPIEALRTAVREQLKIRENWRAALR